VGARGCDSPGPPGAGPFPIPPIPTVLPIPTLPPIPGGTYEVGLFGDMPYGDYGRAKYPNLIDDMNRTNLAFSVFDGDIKMAASPAMPTRTPRPGPCHSRDGRSRRHPTRTSTSTP
jgi:hypothetical protein